MSKQYQITGSGSNAIVESVERGVGSGSLPPGARLPTVRGLAERLDLSLGTVAAAYRILAARGIAVADGRRGTVIRPAPPLARSVSPVAVGEGLHDLATGNPDPKLLPPLAPALRAVPREPHLYGEDAEDPNLLTAAARSFGADGIDARDICIVHGALDGIERALAARLRPGDRVAVEDPVYPAHLDLLSALGLIAEPVTIDARGMLPDRLELAMRRGVRAIVVSPRAQNPTGAAFDRARQHELRAVLERDPSLLVIEDDHAWLVAGTPYRTLTHARESWFAVRSFSKAFGPDLRIAIAAGDAMTIARIKGRQRIGIGWVSRITQSIAHALWSDARVLERAHETAAVYAERRGYLLDALEREGIAVDAPSGLNCWVPVRDESAAIAGLRAAGFAVAPGERFRIAAPPAVRVTTARIGEREACTVARAIAAVTGATGLTRSA